MRSTIFILACLLLAIPCKAETIIVDPNGSADYTSIQDAINYSWHGDTIIVRPGAYNENISFNGRAITLTSESPDDPNIVESTIITADSDYSVTFEFAEGSDSILTGFTITGRGILCYDSSPTITKNVIRNFPGTGNGVAGQYDAAPTITENIIGPNIHTGIQSCHGLIARNFISGNYEGISGCDGTIKKNLIKNNDRWGLNSCEGLILNNIISGNHEHGISYSDGTISNNVIIGNTQSGLKDCDAVVTNNIIAHNRLYGILEPCNNSYNAFWMNGRNFYSGAMAGVGDIHINPLFAVEGYWDGSIWADGDYHLRSGAGRWDPNTQTWIIDDINSPCIDAGDPNDDIGYEPNPNGSRINIGAYGGTAEASKSPSGIVEPVCTHYPTMDYNKDCKVDFKDFAMLAQTWLECNLDPPSACWE